jgi:ferredoxin
MRASGATRLRLDPVACTGHGLCAQLLAERIRLDEWGYPIVDGRPLPAELEEHARLAARECPTRALRLRRVS